MKRLFIIRKFHRAVGSIVCPPQLKGLDHLMDARLNKDLAFTLAERKTLGIHGLTPPCIKTPEQQLKLAALSINAYTEPLNKYLFMMDLQDMNERLFYRFLVENIEYLMPIVYTPTVGLACQRFSLVFRRPRGLFISINDRHHVLDVVKNWPDPNVRAVCVTDGENVLGLGDLGAYGMGISVGKTSLYTAVGGVKPNYALPVVIDVGTNNEDLLNDPLYMGLNQKRVGGMEYEELMDEFMQAIVTRWGPKTLIQFAGFNYSNGLHFLNRYHSSYCSYNDDIQGEAAVTLAGLFASTRITGKKMSEYTYLFVGTGAGSLNIAYLLEKAIVSKDISQEQALKKIWMVNSKGLLTTKSSEKALKGRRKYAKEHEPIKDLEDIVAKLKPDVIIGCTQSPGLFTPKLLKTMAANCERPVIFPLSAPIEKIECTAEEAYQHTDGRAVFSSKIAFAPVTVNDRTFVPRHSYNAYLFPGLVMAIISTSVYHVSADMFIIAACELSKCVEENELQSGSLFPPTNKVIDINRRIALVVIDLAYEQGVASLTPKPKNIPDWLRGVSYDYNYKPSIPHVNPWPTPPAIQVKEIHPVLAMYGEQEPEKSPQEATAPDQKGQAQATAPDQKGQTQAKAPDQKGQVKATETGKQAQAQATATGQQAQAQAAAAVQKEQAQATAVGQKAQTQATEVGQKAQTQATAVGQKTQTAATAAIQKGQAQTKPTDQQSQVQAKAPEKKDQKPTPDQKKPKDKNVLDPKKPGNKK